MTKSSGKNKPRGMHYGEWLVSKLLPTTDGCLEPTGLRKHNSGYYRVGGGGYPSTGAHRAVWEWLNGPIEVGMLIDHTCRNRGCCNVDHLRVVTPKTNITENVVGCAWQVHAAKTHCPNGHPYSGHNLYVSPLGDRHCRECRAAADRRFKRKKRAKV